jgi:MFS family permease
MAADFVPSKLRASGIGWYSTTIGMTGLIASVVAGQLWDKVSHPSVFIFGALFSFIGIISLILFVPDKKAKVDHG